MPTPPRETILAALLARLSAQTDRLVDARGSGRVMFIGLGLLTFGALLLAFLPNATGWGGYILAIAALTPGYQLFLAANNTAALADASPKRYGTISGLLGLSRNIGLIIGASVMGGIFAFGAGTDEFAHAPKSAMAAGMRLTFLTACGLMVVSAGVVWSAGWARRPQLAARRKDAGGQRR